MRKIDIAGFVPATLRDQPAPQLIWAEVADLVIDDNYQRTLTRQGRQHIQRIADGWDWTKFQPILVAPTPDGGLAIVDGQHRAHAAALVGLTTIPAMTVAMTPAEQASGFAAVNRDRIGLGLSNIYRAELAAGTEWAVAAERAVSAAGCVLLTYHPSASLRRPGDVTAHSLIRAMIEAGEGEAVTAGLRAIRDSVQGSAGTDAYDGRIIKAWLPLIAENQRYMRLPLAAIFDHVDWEGEFDAAKARARIGGPPARTAVMDRVRAHLRSSQQVAA